jgi:hypothetical protein
MRQEARFLALIGVLPSLAGGEGEKEGAIQLSSMLKD